jgi:hypothetical protein
VLVVWWTKYPLVELIWFHESPVPRVLSAIFAGIFTPDSCSRKARRSRDFEKFNPFNMRY